MQFSQNYWDGFDDGKERLKAMEYPDGQAGDDYRAGYQDGITDTSVPIGWDCIEAGQELPEDFQF